MWILNKIANLFQLNDENWMRHANPRSVYTRYLWLPLIVLALFSREFFWIYFIIPTILVIFFIVFNPIMFPKPKSTKNWASRGVFGERVYLNAHKIPIPQHHSKIIKVINIIMFLWIPFLVYWLYYLHIRVSLFGTVIIILGKTRFLDRMVWLYTDMKNKSKEYTSREY